jgi:hypothetical protein
MVKIVNHMKRRPLNARTTSAGQYSTTRMAQGEKENIVEYTTTFNLYNPALLPFQDIFLHLSFFLNYKEPNLCQFEH